MRIFSCEHCGARVYLSSDVCVHCHAQLGYVPEERRMGSFLADEAGTLRRAVERAEVWQRCEHYHSVTACNWMVRAEDSQRQCLACRLTVSIPDQSIAENQSAWRDLESAKRSWMVTVLDLGLPVRSQTEDPDQGLAFHFLRQIDAARPVLTGHDAGDITINAIESDPVQRERSKIALFEPYRTLLGHFRHESGHYYWDLLIRDTEHLEPFRALFGDERESYQDALARHYENGPSPDWQSSHVSGYATMHPWEDWAETWAHYLHMIDLLSTAADWQLSVGAFRSERVYDLAPDDAGLSEEFLDILSRWMPLTLVVNSLNRSLGHADAYPFALAYAALRKIQFVHDVIRPLVPADARPWAPGGQAGSPAQEGT